MTAGIFRGVRVAIAASALAMFAAPALAQFGTIFGDPPPRPPANVPSQPPADDRYPQRYPQYPVQPPATPERAPQTLTPPRGVQTEPLPPPPGVAATPPDAQPQQPPRGPLTGLPPGQRQPRGTPQPADTAPQPGDEVIAEPPAQKIPNAHAVFSGLDKITGRIISFDVAINETVQFGALQVVPRVCYTRPPTEAQNTNAFIEVSEVTLQGEVRRIFTGWMYASSPGLNAVEHPIYDIWLTDCKQPLTQVAEEAPAQQARPQAPQPSARTPLPRPAQRPPAAPGPFLNPR
ncbi:MAG: DUF2155 domain-containing protein [Pseudorhodoplanes sp.]|nr:DUF2155 domain-containing protein [Pseudorhodoplanes sp.]